MPGGTEARVSFKVQSAINTPATGTYGDILLDDFSYDAGRIYNYGRPRIGGSISQKNAGIVLGAKPFCSGSGPTDLNTLGVLFEGAGRSSAVVTTTNTLTENTASSAIKYLTADIFPVTGLQERIRDYRLSRLVVNHPSADESTFEFTGLGGNMDDSTATHGAAATPKMPSPAETISAANANIAGTTGTTILSFQYMILQSLANNRQPLGTVTPDDIRVTAIQTMAVLALDLTSSNLHKFMFGASGATAVGTTSLTGAQKVRISVPGATSYIDYDWAGAEYALDQAARIRAQEEQILVVRARPTSTVTETIVTA